MVFDWFKKSQKKSPYAKGLYGRANFDHSGHLVFFPLNAITYQKLKNREIVEGDLTKDDLVDFRKEKVTVFHLFDVSADCNENVFYIIGEVLKFFRALHSPYIYSSYTNTQ